MPRRFSTHDVQSDIFRDEETLESVLKGSTGENKNMCSFRVRIRAAPREGAYLNGLYMEGARWDVPSGMIAEARLKELLPLMPVVYVKAITQDKQETKNIYECPLYRTKMRGPTFIWTFNLKTRDKPTKWTLAGVAIILQI